MFIQICVGSSCYLKGSQEIVELFNNAIEENHLEGDVVLSGSFCIGKCNRTGVTVQVDDDIHVGVTRENFKEFFTKNVLEKIKGAKNDD
ncbi:MAG: (2Fe-2S) ferredoxin domain-containing protein [Clostridiales bacterium]|nr:(2Fe-2S) ferredoxin domain-containing protein [Clostridiales bacterium]